MKTWLTSDLHLFHDNIIVYCGRPHQTSDEMNDFIVEAWNSVVAPDDRVIVVGDLSAGLRGRYNDLANIIGRLRGRKTLIRGNHDHRPDAWYVAAGFESVTDWLLEDGILFIHKPATQFNTETLRVCENLDYELIVHGHIHVKMPEIPGHFNVAWDRHGRLINLEEIRDGIQNSKDLG